MDFRGIGLSMLAQAVMLRTFIHEVPGLNLGEDA
jgi:hypothetical protein